MNKGDFSVGPYLMQGLLCSRHSIQLACAAGFWSNGSCTHRGDRHRPCDFS